MISHIKVQCNPLFLASPCGIPGIVRRQESRFKVNLAGRAGRVNSFEDASGIKRQSQDTELGTGGTTANYISQMALNKKFTQ